MNYSEFTYMTYLKQAASMVIVIAGLSLIGCDDNLVELIDPVVQRTEDLQIIEDFVAENGYTPTDTTTSGVRYHILDVGSGASIDINDHVSYNYTLTTASSDSILLTNIRQVAIDNGLLDSTRTYEPRIFTYSQSTWTVSSILRSAFSGEELSETGFKEGLVVVTGKMNVGGHAVLMIPSGLMYGSQPLGTIPANSVIIIEIFLVKVLPQ